METVFVDAGVFLAFLSGEHRGRYAKARDLFQRAEAGGIRLETTELVLGEVARALMERFGMKRDEVSEVLDSIINIRNLRVPNRNLLRQAVEVYGTTSAGFVDAYNIAWLLAHGRGRIASFEPGKYRARGLEVL